MFDIAEMVEIPIVGDEAIEKWKAFLKVDAIQNGGSASIVLRRVIDNKPLKITAFSDGLIVVDILDGFSLAEELSAFQMQLVSGE